jgi:hypothetical protein
MLKKIIIATVIIIGVLTLNYTEHHYTREVVVREVDCLEVTVEDKQGHLWTLKGTDYTVDQEITVVMYDNATSIITDDEIVRVK